MLLRCLLLLFAKSLLDLLWPFCFAIASTAQIRTRLLARQVHHSCCLHFMTVPDMLTTQLILPEALKLLPAYAASIIRNIAFRPGGDVGSDERVHAMQQLQGMSPRDVVPFLYPRMVSLHDVLEGEGEVIPASIRASYARLKEHGVYLLETGQDMFMWIGRAVAAPWVQQVIGAAAFQSIDVAMVRCALTLSRSLHHPFPASWVVALADMVGYTAGAWKSPLDASS
jgi:hypothetical protein